MNKVFRSRQRWLSSSRLVMAFCGALTVFIFASSVETVFNQDLPFVSAVSSVELAPVQRIVDNRQGVDQGDVGNYGKPLYIKIPSREVKLLLAPAIRQEGAFLARANSGHFLLTSISQKGMIGDAVIYSRTTWRTDSQPEQITVGENLFIDTDRDWRYFYRVTAVKAVGAEDLYVARDDPNSQLYMVAVDPSDNRLYIAQATLINVQNVRL